MFEFFRAGGPLMWVILVCSIVALTIVFERFLALRKGKVVPSDLADQVLNMVREKKINAENISIIREHSPLGFILAAGLSNFSKDSDVLRETLEDAGKLTVHRLGRYLNTLGTIASITPLIGLLGTVLGMIKVFTAITANGVGDPTILSGGISEALITTAAGLAVGIPSLMLYRHFKSRVAELTVQLEDQALRLLELTK
jgi:biopolymer transport protein ExbB